MGKQNIVSGGFYGKVGQLIGQRWKNIRTVRAYVKPKNPRTEKQQANRKQFGGYIPLCQLAMQLNYKAPYFRSENNSEWGLRMSLASSLLKSGYELLNLIPIIPMDYTPAYTVSEITAIDTANKKRPKIYVRGTLPDTPRSISVVVAFYDEQSESYDNQMFNTTLQDGANPYFELSLSGNVEIDENSRFIIVSNNDAEQSIPDGFENVTIASKMMSYDVIPPIYLENLNYAKSVLNSAFISFTAGISSLSELGILDDKTLSEVYSTAGTSHANCQFRLYDAENENPAVLSCDTSISALSYISDTEIGVTLKLLADVDITQSIKEIVKIDANSLFVKSLDNTKPVIYILEVTNQQLQYETFTQPSAVIPTALIYNKTLLQSNIIAFSATVQSLAQYGITDTASLKTVWNIAKASSANGSFKLYDASKSADTAFNSDVSITNLEYVSDTRIKITLSLSATINDIQAIAEITNIADGALKIESNRVRNPNLQLSAFTNVVLTHETFSKPSAVTTSNYSWEQQKLQNKNIVFTAQVKSLSQFGITNNAQLVAMWSVANASTANISLKIYTAGVASDSQVTVSAKISAIEYVSDSRVKITLATQAVVNDIQAISGIVSIANGALNIPNADVRNPNFEISAISNVTLSHETFTKPSAVTTSGNVYEVAEPGVAGFVFTTNVSSLAKYGITNTDTLLNIWKLANATSATGTYSVFDTGSEEARSASGLSQIIDMAYISDTKISVTVEIAMSVSETEVVNGITLLANKAIGIPSNNIRYPDFAVSEIKDVEIDF